MLTIPDREKAKSLRDSIRKCVRGADFPDAKKGLHFGPHFFNRIEIGAIRGKIYRGNVIGSQKFSHSLHAMGTHIVHHNNISRV